MGVSAALPLQDSALETIDVGQRLSSLPSASKGGDATLAPLPEARIKHVQAERAFAVVGLPLLLSTQRELLEDCGSDALAKLSYDADAGQHERSLSREEVARTLPRCIDTPALVTSQSYYRRNGIPRDFRYASDEQKSSDSYAQHPRSCSPDVSHLPDQPQKQLLPQHSTASSASLAPSQQVTDAFGAVTRILYDPSAEYIGSRNSDESKPKPTTRRATQTVSQAHSELAEDAPLPKILITPSASPPRIAPARTRTDFQNLRRFSRPQSFPSRLSLAATAAQDVSRTLSTTPRQPAASLPASPATAKHSSSSRTSLRFEPGEATDVSAPTKPRAVTRKTVPSGFEGTSPGGHVMDHQNVALLLLADGAARPVCSPTPARLPAAAADGQARECTAVTQPECDASLTASRDTFGPGAATFQHADELAQRSMAQDGEAAEETASIVEVAARQPLEANTFFRSSFSSDATAFDVQRGNSMEMQRSSSSRVLAKRMCEGVERPGNNHGDFAPPSAVLETREPSEVQSDAGNRTDGSMLRFIQIVKSIRPGSAQPRPGTAQTRLSTNAVEPHVSSPACRQCFRSGFDCATNLQLGSGTLGRQAFQDFVAAGCANNALSLAGAAADVESLAASRVVGRNFVDKLGEIAFGESAVSRPVTRGRTEDMHDNREQEASQVKDELEAQSSQILQDHALFEQVFRALDAMEAPVTPENIDTSGDSDRSSSIDNLPFLADRWPAWRKCLQIGVYCVWLLMLQAFDSASSKSRGSLVLDAGRIGFLLGESGGVLTGAGLATLGRRRLTLSSSIVLIMLAVAGGFSEGAVLISIRSIMGFCAGVFLLAQLGMIIDMFISRRSRIAAFGVCIGTATAGQLTGPWIAVLITGRLTRGWIYWCSSIASFVALLLLGFLTSETSALALFRARMASLRRFRNGWMPEPRAKPTFRQLPHHLLRPYRVLFTHWIVSLSALTVTSMMGSLAFAYGGIADVFIDTHGFTVWQANLALTVCGVTGSLAAGALLSLFSDSAKARNPNSSTLTMLTPERSLKPAVFGAPAAVLALYSLALTASLKTWVLGAVSLAVLSGASILLVVGMLSFVSEAYHSAALTQDREVLACQPLDAYTSPVRSHSLQVTVECSKGIQKGRLGAEWAICALAGIVGAGFASVAAFTAASHFAFAELSFASTIAVVASCALCASALPFVLQRYGARMRQRSALRAIAMH